MTDTREECGTLTTRKFLLAFALPIVLDALLLRAVPHDLFVPWVASALVGFLFLTRRCAPRTRVIIALGYFPFIFLIFFFGSLFLPFLAVTIRE